MLKREPIEVQPAGDAADEGLVGMFTQLQLGQGPVDHLDRLAQLVAGGSQDDPVVHIADVEQAQPLQPPVQGTQLRITYYVLRFSIEVSYEEQDA